MSKLTTIEGPDIRLIVNCLVQALISEIEKNQTSSNRTSLRECVLNYGDNKFDEFASWLELTIKNIFGTDNKVAENRIFCDAREEDFVETVAYGLWLAAVWAQPELFLWNCVVVPVITQSYLTNSEHGN